MPADKYDFRPANGTCTSARTFGEQVKHIATMIYMTAAIVLEEKSPYGPGPVTTDRHRFRGTIDLEYLAHSIESSRKAVASLNGKNQLDALKTSLGLADARRGCGGITHTATTTTVRWSCTRG